jgi:hypothetical protein
METTLGQLNRMSMKTAAAVVAVAATTTAAAAGTVE